MVKIQNSQKTNLLYKKPFQVLRLLVHKQEHFIWRTGPCCRESPYPNSQLHGISFQLRTAGSIRACISQCLVMAARGLPELHAAISAWTSSPRAGSHLFKIVGPTLLRPTLLSQAAPGRQKHWGFINRSTTIVYQLNRQSTSTNKSLLWLTCCPIKRMFSKKPDFKRKLHEKYRFLTGFTDRSHPSKQSDEEHTFSGICYRLTHQ